MAKVIPHRFYRTPNGGTVSIFSGFVPAGSKIETKGYTISWPDGTTGTGRKPYDTAEEAQAHIDRNPNFSGMGQG